MTNTYKILGQGLTSDLLDPALTTKKATVYQVPENTNSAVSAIVLTNAGDEDAFYDLALVKDSEVSSEVENVDINIETFRGFVVAANNSNTGRYSEDGVTWQAITFPGDLNYDRVVAYGDGRFIAMSYDMNSMGGTPNNWATSVDGINWTQITSLNNFTPVSLRYINNRFVAMFLYTNEMVTSEDGITWTNISPQHITPGMISFIYARDIAYGNGLYVLIGAYEGTVYSSPDLLTWTNNELARTQYNAIIYANNKFLAVSGYTNAYSENGVDWTQTLSASAPYGSRSVAYGNGKFVINGGGEGIQRAVSYSTDGIDWIAVEHGESGFMNIGEIIYANNLFVLVGTSTMQNIRTSPDAITWTQVQLSSSFMSVAAGVEYFIDTYSVPVTLNKHKIISRKKILAGETQEIKGGITLSAGDQIRVISSANEIITNVYGVEIS